ncbi:hypothetical protein ACSZNR_09145 [Aeromonas caviae]|uniref:hypothetical protein n=1 Tax=Aeromonas caviae TaxID=648 RepID=UPI00137699D4|nr:hypothetical protein [Aeromonas caviae]DAW19208.1 MAG TPA: hypothetical protein [Caudoviricetes sp.]MDX7748727.1 hypothetical protein [Aeromonas caviae]MDY7798849.1 hypothetical protein [Aeromonas caviae]MDY7891889.1 hypothetical protein [Aeromonas caviae]NBA13423.1 hypothetical protein [Aeromonas caviae]
MNFKYFIIHTTNWIISKVPLFFSKRMVFISKGFFEGKTQESEFLKKYEAIKTYSFLDPRLNWKLKAINSACTIPAEQVNKIHKWKGKTDLPRFRPTNKASINDESMFNIGYFTTNKSRSYDTIFLGVNSELVKGCNVYLIGCSNGTYYLSMYWYLSDEATALVKDIDISKLENTKVNYFTCNPFSELYGISSWENKISQANKIVTDRFNSISRELDYLEKRLMNVIQIGNVPVTVRNLDILLKDNEPYFLDEETFQKAHRENEHQKVDFEFRLDECLVGRASFPDLFLIYKSAQEREFLLKYIPHIDSFPFEQIFIKSENLTQDEVSQAAYATFEYAACHISNSHNSLAIYYLAEKKFTKMSDSYSDYILSYKMNPEKHYDVLYKAFIEVDSIENQIKNSISRIPSIKYECSNRHYIDSLSIRCRSLLKRVKEVKDDIVRRKNNSNELVQYENLKYQRKNSLLVVMLAIIQIALAYATWKYTGTS